MTNYDYLCSSKQNLADFLEKVQDDALAAKGCSMYLKLPDAEFCVDWVDWLDRERDENDG